MAVPTAGEISWLGIAEAVAEAGCSVRTMHRWIADGTVKSELFPDGRRRVDPSTLPRKPPPAGQDAANGVTAAALEVERLKERVDGALVAVRLHAKRAEDAREEGARVEALMREIKLKLEEENRYLREQLDKRAEESGQLRVLLHQSELNVGRLTEKLMSLPGEKPKAWWQFWRRG
jgi:hypothetical protein